nr:type IV pilin N-terminal domain-containing protein [Natronorubrum halophilum]
MGVILMVTITVILAAVIAAFVLAMGNLDESAPSAQYEWESSGSDFAVSHTSGDDISMSDLTIRVTVDGNTESGVIGSGSGEYTAGDTIDITTATGSADEVEVTFDGTPTTITGSSYSHSSGTAIDKVTIVWESDDTSNIIAEHEP